LVQSVTGNNGVRGFFESVAHDMGKLTPSTDTRGLFGGSIPFGSDDS
jgi:hypothetical protein